MMLAMQLELFFLFFPSLFLNIGLSNESPSNEKCYLFNQQSKETWKLVWQDNFQSQDYFNENWAIDHRSGLSFYKQLSCNVRENVKLQDGCLVMSAKEEKYDQWNFTGARLSTKRVFGYGRFEARAAFSADNYVWSSFFTMTNDWENDGYLIMHRFDNISKSLHMADFPNKDKVFKYNKFDINYSLFHRYGMEWSEKEVKFFVDDHYSESMLLNATRMVKPEQQIRLWQGVFAFNKPFPKKHHWKCPLFIVDYVRFYEKVLNLNAGLKMEMCEDENDVDQSSKKQRELVNSICAKHEISPVTQITKQPIPTTKSTTYSIGHQANISNHNSTFENSSSFHWSNINSIVYVTFGISTLLFIAFIVRLRYRINKMKQPNLHSPPLNEIELEDRHQYETISYDDVRETNF